MLRIGTGIYVRIGDDASRRVLHPANIVRVLKNTYSAEIKGEHLALEEGHEFHVYYVLQRKFVQQAARIESVTEDGETFIITFATAANCIISSKCPSSVISAIVPGDSLLDPWV